MGRPQFSDAVESPEDTATRIGNSGNDRNTDTLAGNSTTTDTVNIAHTAADFSIRRLSFAYRNGNYPADDRDVRVVLELSESNTALLTGHPNQFPVGMDSFVRLLASEDFQVKISNGSSSQIDYQWTVSWQGLSY